MNNHDKDNSKKKNATGLHELFFGVASLNDVKSSNPIPEQNPIYLERRRQYAGIPEDYINSWQASDERLPSSDEWQNLLVSTDAAVQEVSAICRYHETKTDRMTVNRLLAEKKALLYALHKMEELIEQLDWSYPTEDRNCIKLAKDVPALTGRIPEILVKTEDRILIWMPRLPATAKWARSVGYKELTDLLYQECANLPRLGQWHCDFFHVFDPQNLVGVRDVDNYAYKPIIDSLARALCANDGYDNFSCAMFNYPSETLKIGCYIHIYKRAEKVAFFQDFESLASTALKAKND